MEKVWKLPYWVWYLSFREFSCLTEWERARSFWAIIGQSESAKHRKRMGSYISHAKAPLANWSMRSFLTQWERSRRPCAKIDQSESQASKANGKVPQTPCGGQRQWHLAKNCVSSILWRNTDETSQFYGFQDRSDTGVHSNIHWKNFPALILTPTIRLQIDVGEEKVTILSMVTC